MSSSPELTEARLTDPMAQWVADFSGHLKQCLAFPIQGIRPIGAYSNVVVCAMGGSAIGGDLLNDALGGRLAIPLFVNRYPQLPMWVNATTLVVVASYSGNTQETLSAGQIAAARGAKVIVLTSGGKLEEWANEHHYLLLKIPGGMAPRAALGYLFIGLWRLLSETGVAPVPDQEMQSAIEMLCTAVETFHSDKNPARPIAELLNGKIPWILSSRRLAGVARRWANQLSENAKVPAHFNQFPEALHNEIVGLCDDPNRMRGIQTVILRDCEEDNQLSRAVSILHDAGHRPILIKRGGEDIGSLLYMIALGDQVSLALAGIQNVLPTPIPAIEHLKKPVV